MRFKPGQKVVCINKDGWMSLDDYELVPGPLFNQVYMITSYECEGYCRVYEFSQTESWNEEMFEPLMDISELTEILEQQPEHA
jgi:hypothetical protein